MVDAGNCCKAVRYGVSALHYCLGRLCDWCRGANGRGAVCMADAAYMYLPRAVGD